MLHCLYIFPRCFRSLVVGVFQLPPVEEFSGRIRIGTTTPGADGLDQFGVDLSVTDRLHHGKMLKIVVCLEQCVSREELDNDAAYAPDVAGEAPSQLQNDLRGSVMPS